MFQIPLPSAAPADSVPSVHNELASLKNMSFDDLITKLVGDIVHFAISLAVAIVVFYAGKFIITRLYNITASILIRRNVDESLSTFILSFLRIVLYFILIVTVIGILGIPTSSFLALFASAGVAVGMALSGTLQNFAGGVLILLLKPYREATISRPQAMPEPSAKSRYSPQSSTPPTTSPSSFPTVACQLAASTTGADRNTAAWTGL